MTRLRPFVCTGPALTNSATARVGAGRLTEEPEPPPLSPLALVVAAIRSIVAYVAVSTYVLIVAPPGMLLAIVFNWPDVLYMLGHGGVAMGLGLVGIRYRVLGREHVPTTRAVVFVSNHQSNVDPPLLYRVLHRRLHLIYKAELQKLPILARAFGIAGFIAIDRRHREQAMAAIERAAAALRAGTSFLMFPEGTRSRTGELLPFKKGGFIMALKAEAPIVPVAISGARAAMKKGSTIIRPVTVTVRIGRPVETANRAPDDREGLIDEVRARIEQMLQMGPIADQNAEHRRQNTE